MSIFPTPIIVAIGSTKSTTAILVQLKRSREDLVVLVITIVLITRASRAVFIIGLETAIVGSARTLILIQRPAALHHIFTTMGVVVATGARRL